MTQAATISPSPTAPPAPLASIETRFGALALDPARLIDFPSGLMGFSDPQRFALLDLPDAGVPFKLLQSVDDPELAFLVLPIDPADGTIASVDLSRAAATLGFDRAALAVVGIVTVRQNEEGVHFTINLKAPLLIDAERRVGAQHVLVDDGYQLRHPLPGTASQAG